MKVGRKRQVVPKKLLQRTRFSEVRLLLIYTVIVKLARTCIRIEVTHSQLFLKTNVFLYCSDGSEPRLGSNSTRGSPFFWRARARHFEKGLVLIQAQARLFEKGLENGSFYVVKIIGLSRLGLDFI